MSLALHYPAIHPKVILGVAAHPDDLDFAAAGSIAGWVAEGAKAYYLILTDGAKGTADRDLTPSDLTKLRQKEQTEAGRQLGLSQVLFAGFKDGELACNLAVKKAVVRAIRQLKPDVVITMDPTMAYSARHHFINHPDHRAAGQATLDAVYPLARDHLAFPELATQEGLEPHKTATVLLANFEHQNFFVAIDDYLKPKMAALAAHHSQVPPRMLEVAKNIARDCGNAADCDYAEGFMRIDLD